MVELYSLDRFVDGIETLLKKTVKDLGAARGSLMAVDHREKVLKIKVATSLNPSGALHREIIEKTRTKVGDGVAGMVAKTGKPLLINDIEELKKAFPRLRTSTDAGSYESSLVVPIKDEGSVIAVLNISDKKDGGKFTEEDLHSAELLGEYCAVAIKLERQNKGVLLVNEIIREISLTNSLHDIYKLVTSK
ncbi:MAG TPA: GAF domain-containing protein, partial [Nitrospirota bacterium]|nr:GAF domain-containing protein [Nitrospirota bacterium]